MMQMGASEKMAGGKLAISSARRKVRALTKDYGSDVSAVAELLAGELLTNAVVHGGGRFAMEASVDEVAVLHVVVVDEAPTQPPVVKRTGPLAEGGRGLVVIDAMASAWGSKRLGAEKAVWFDLDLRS